MIRAGMVAVALGAAVGPPAAVWMALAVGAARWLADGVTRQTLGPLTSVALFAGTLAALEWIGRGAVSLLPVRAVAVFLASRAALRGLQAVGWLAACPARSYRWRALLACLFTAHFVDIFGEQTRRALIAQRLAAPRRLAPGWWRSLTYALSNIFAAALSRAERFYAALWLRGLE